MYQICGTAIQLRWLLNELFTEVCMSHPKGLEG